MGGGICFYDIKRYVDRVCDIFCAVYNIVENEDELQAVAKIFAELMEDVDFQI